MTTSTRSLPPVWPGSVCGATATIRKTMPRPSNNRAISSARINAWCAAGACDFPAKPSLDWDGQTVIWAPRSHSAILFLAALTPEPPTIHDRSDAIVLDDAISADDGLHLRLRTARIDSQMLVLGPAPRNGRLAAVVPLDADGLDRIRELERLWRVLHGRALPQEKSIPIQKRRNLRLMLRTVDGRSEDASLREIAEVFFGAERVASDPWKTSSLRDKMNRLFRGGRKMVAGGYRQFLRSRRRP